MNNKAKCAKYIVLYTPFLFSAIIQILDCVYNTNINVYNT